MGSYQKIKKQKNKQKVHGPGHARPKPVQTYAQMQPIPKHARAFVANMWDRDILLIQQQRPMSYPEN